MLGARKMIWKQLGLTLGGLVIGLMLCGVSGCNDQDDAAAMAQAFAQQNASTTKPASTPMQTQTPPPAVQNPCGEGEPGEEQAYSGPNVIVTEYFVKLPYESFTGARRFDIRCTVQAEEEVNSKAIWEIVALDANDETVGTQKQHLAIPFSYSRPLDINSFYCTEVPARVEFRLTDKVAIPLDADQTSGGGRGTTSGGGIR